MKIAVFKSRPFDGLLLHHAMQLIIDGMFIDFFLHCYHDLIICPLVSLLFLTLLLLFVFFFFFSFSHFFPFIFFFSVFLSLSFLLFSFFFFFFLSFRYLEDPPTSPGANDDDVYDDSKTGDGNDGLGWRPDSRLSPPQPADEVQVLETKPRFPAIANGKAGSAAAAAAATELDSFDHHDEKTQLLPDDDEDDQEEHKL